MTKSIKNASAFSLEIKENGIGVISIDVADESMNVLKAEFAEQVTEVLDQVEANKDIVGLVLVSGKDNSFVAGADVAMLDSCETAEQVKEIASTGDSKGKKDFTREWLSGASLLIQLTANHLPPLEQHQFSVETLSLSANFRNVSSYSKMTGLAVTSLIMLRNAMLHLVEIPPNPIRFSRRILSMVEHAFTVTYESLYPLNPEYYDSDTVSSASGFGNESGSEEEDDEDSGKSSKNCNNKHEQYLITTLGKIASSIIQSSFSLITTFEDLPCLKE